MLLYWKLCLHSFFYDGPWGRELAWEPFFSCILKKGNLCLLCVKPFSVRFNVEFGWIPDIAALGAACSEHTQKTQSSTLLHSRVVQQRGRSWLTVAGATVCPVFVEGVGRCVYTFLLARTNSKVACTVFVVLCVQRYTQHFVLPPRDNTTFINIRAPLIYEYCVLCQRTWTHTGT